MKYFFLATIVAFFLYTSAISAQDDPGFVPAKITTTPRATSPAESVTSGLGGKVRVKVTIDESGNVSSADEVAGPGFVCRQVTRDDVLAMRKAAKEAALQAKFTPATRNGLAAASTTWLTFDFPGSEALEDLNARNKSSDEKNYTAGEKYTIASSELSNDDKTPVSPRKEVDPAAIPKQINGGVINGKANVLAKPPYPPAARAVRASGAVNVQVLIDEEGNVFASQAVTGHPLLRSVSTIAACESRFAPTRLSGYPVKVAGIITYNFVP